MNILPRYTKYLTPRHIIISNLQRFATGKVAYSRHGRPVGGHIAVAT